VTEPRYERAAFGRLFSFPGAHAYCDSAGDHYVAGHAVSPVEKAKPPVAGEENRPMSNDQGTSQAQNGPIETAEGREVVISFEAKRCIHARFCVLGQPGVFKANVVGAWIAPDDATSVADLVAVAQNCPSGAIQYRRKDGGQEEAAPLVNLIRVRENGPLAFRGPLMLDGVSVGYRATLCRCGQSKNKPFCDNSHKDAGFTATGEPATGDVTPLASRNGPVTLAAMPNGPLAVTGNLEIISGTGRTIRKAEKVTLCRCGASANKPYCDGSHARIGFRS